MMKLTLVEKGNFLGKECDFYVNEDRNIFMSKKQIGEALQYKYPMLSIRILHLLNKERLDPLLTKICGTDLVPTEIRKNGCTPNKVLMYNEEGIYEICRRSKQKTADSFYNYIYQILSSINENHFGIAKISNEKPSGMCKDPKKPQTGVISDFIKLVTVEGKWKAVNFYRVFTKIVDETLDIQNHNNLDQLVLSKIAILEHVVVKNILAVKDVKTYKEVYQEIEKIIKEFKWMVY